MLYFHVKEKTEIRRCTVTTITAKIWDDKQENRLIYYQTNLVKMHSSVLALSSTWKIAPHSIGDNRIGGGNIFPHCLILHSFAYFHGQLYPYIIIAEANSTAQNFVDFTEAEEDLVSRMHRLVGNRSVYKCVFQGKIKYSVPHSP